jgi:uncharacterized small protein (DUF1192 family)
MICPRAVAGVLKSNLISQPQGCWQPLEPGEARMAIEDDDRPRKKVTHEIGQDLSLLSVDELAERIALMNSEIERLQAAIVKKRASKDAAANFFKS